MSDNPESLTDGQSAPEQSPPGYRIQWIFDLVGVPRQGLNAQNGHLTSTARKIDWRSIPDDIILDISSYLMPSDLSAWSQSADIVRYRLNRIDKLRETRVLFQTFQREFGKEKALHPKADDLAIAFELAAKISGGGVWPVAGIVFKKMLDSIPTEHPFYIHALGIGVAAAATLPQAQTYVQAAVREQLSRMEGHFRERDETRTLNFIKKMRNFAEENGIPLIDLTKFQCLSLVDRIMKFSRNHEMAEAISNVSEIFIYLPKYLTEGEKVIEQWERTKKRIISRILTMNPTDFELSLRGLGPALLEFDEDDRNNIVRITLSDSMNSVYADILASLIQTPNFTEPGEQKIMLDRLLSNERNIIFDFIKKTNYSLLKLNQESKDRFFSGLRAIHLSEAEIKEITDLAPDRFKRALREQLSEAA